MIGDLVPSYLLKLIGAALLFAAILAEGTDRVLFLVGAYAAASLAWFISTRLAKRWFWLHKRPRDHGQGIYLETRGSHETNPFQPLSGDMGQVEKPGIVGDTGVGGREYRYD